MVFEFFDFEVGFYIVGNLGNLLNIFGICEEELNWLIEFVVGFVFNEENIWIDGMN